MRKSKSLLAVLSLLLSAAPAVALTPTASLRTQTVEIHEARIWAATLYDARRHRIVYFGGSPSYQNPQNDVSVLQLGTVHRWIPVTCAGTPPPKSSDMFAVYDSLGDRMLVFEEAAGSGVWSLALAEPMAWTELHPSGTRPTLRGSMAIFDPVRRRVVGFGGRDPQNVTLATNWSLELSGAPAWTTYVTAGVPAPSRTDHEAIYDGALRRMLVFGGHTNETSTGFTRRNDIWALPLDGLPTWTPLAINGTPPRPVASPAVAFDPASRRMLVFSGSENDGSSTSDALHVVDFSSEPGTWVPVTANPRAPSRKDAFAEFVPGIGEFIVGEGQSGGVRSDLWSLRVSGATGAWTEPDYIGGRPQYLGEGVAYDRIRRVVVAQVGDWELALADTLRWRHRRSVGDGPGNTPLGAAYDEVTHRMFAFHLGTVYRREPGSPDTWIEQPIVGQLPSQRYSDDFTMGDFGRERILMQGGLRWFVPNDTTHSDLWALDLSSTPVWRQLLPGSAMGTLSGAPPSRDTRRDRIVRHGGCRATSVHACPPSSKTWTTSIGNPVWTELSPLGVPPASDGLHAAVYDSLRDWTFMFDPPGLWALDFAGSPDGRWRPIYFTYGTLEYSSGGAFLDGDQLVLPDVERVQFVSFGPEISPLTVACSPDDVWQAGTIQSRQYEIEHGGLPGTNYSWTLESDRDWPGFPISGSVTFASAGVSLVSIGVPVPDSAAVGENRLTFTVIDSSDPTIRDSCVTRLRARDAGDPAAISLLCAPDVVWTPGEGVTGTFFATLENSSATEIEFVATSARNWFGFPLANPSVPVVNGVAGFAMTFPAPDTALVGTNPITVTVRVPNEAIADSCTWTLYAPGSDIDPPAQEVMMPFPNPASASTQLRFVLPQSSTVRVELRNLATGRVVQARDYGVLGAGENSVGLPLDDHLVSGNYLLRTFVDGRVAADQKLTILR